MNVTVNGPIVKRLKAGETIRFRAMAGLAALAVSFCPGTPTLADPPPAVPAPAILTAMVAREVAAFNAHDAGAVATFHAPDATLKLMPSGTVLASGTDATKAYFAGVFKKYPDFHLTLEKQLVLQTMVIDEFMTTSTPALGKLIAIYNVQNDHIANEWLIFD